MDREFGVTGPQLQALRTIDEIGSCSAGELADRLLVHPSTITGVVQRLEDKGLIDRQRRTDDRRTVEIRLTTAGKRLLHRGRSPGKHLAKALEVMPAEEVSRLRSLLDALVEQMQLDEIESRLLFDEG
ncbi:MarR family winged helix-turn-helix transcriptional regulator [Vulgatibacter incomptus]|nr:MarR family winged helix-turn-helix transcriptional regulator [Vulgatibacter incomptus]